MSSAFPQDQSHNVFGPGAMAVPVPERGTHIPALYVRNPHLDPDLVVRRGDLPLLGEGEKPKPFTISQVAPERRWAVLSNGNVMDQAQFDAGYKQVVLEFYAMLRERGNTGARFEGNIALVPIPDVAEYVSWRVDPDDETKLLAIGYDPHATDGAVSDRFHDAKGEQIMASRLQILEQAYSTAAGRKQMTDTERTEVELHLGLSAQAGSDGVAAKLEVLTDLHKAGKLSSEDYLASVTALSGAEPAREVSAAKQPTLARCGKDDCKGEVGRKAHESRCGKCIGIIAAEEESDS